MAHLSKDKRDLNSGRVLASDASTVDACREAFVVYLLVPRRESFALTLERAVWASTRKDGTHAAIIVAEASAADQMMMGDSSYVKSGFDSRGKCVHLITAHTAAKTPMLMARPTAIFSRNSIWTIRTVFQARKTKNRSMKPEYAVGKELVNRSMWGDLRDNVQPTTCKYVDHGRHLDRRKIANTR